MEEKQITKNDKGQLIREVTDKYIRTWNYDDKTGKRTHYSHTNLGMKLNDKT